MTAKPWQIALIAVGLVVGIASVVYNAVASNSTGADLQYSMLLVDVETGTVYEVSDYRSTPITLPELRPGTQSAALIPIIKSPSGSFQVQPNAMKLLEQVEVPVKSVDKETGSLKAEKPTLERFRR